MIFKNGYSGSLNKCGGLPTHLPEVWPQIDGTDLAFLFQLYCDGEKLNIPNTLCIQGYQLFEEGDYNSDIVVVQLPLNAKENIQQIGLSCPISPDYSCGDGSIDVTGERLTAEKVPYFWAFRASDHQRRGAKMAPKIAPWEHIKG